ncbi:MULTISPECIES: MarR family transcriptional regulator [Streptomyces]|uniref:MarR family transcriptional regulator n=1 Tax=Streptomyces glycanivorans TaxID=3033808 RepID=A0ABY9JDC4_9ACTN|nr:MULTISPECIES: MarR family transcriptional regulator [unclassified Streptomyces]WLQ65765.1 MarR family transcriptional regulator [Streptomyces sp. Alt3]WSQ86549.1 MarR family transcriptional regulator [Streptomyces sp. NBC_01212]WSR07401.1 MarR family transcriptional regulator [Streptomyces sp. NBC_01208]
MAIQKISSALRAPASPRPYPMASPGYGKRSAPDQQPRRADDFMLLPLRERNIAGFIDQLPEGAAMDVKGLAKQLPLYGQQAVGSALKALSVAGYLRRVRCLVTGEGGQVRWVFRTFWSRTARDNEWWGALMAAEVRRAAVPEPVVVVSPAAAAVPQQRTPEPDRPVLEGDSPAYAALAQLGRSDARLALSAADCAVLEPLAAEWFTRGVDADYLVRALVAGLPARVDSPVGLVRRRLTDKIPPQVSVTPVPPAPGTPVRRVMMECTKCGVPGRAEALPDGLCRTCRQPDEGAPEVPAELPAERDVRTYVAELRDLLKAP